MKYYEVNSNTLAIIPINKGKSRVIEANNIIDVEKNTTSIIDYSCRYFGSSYSGRLEGTKFITGISYKTPVLIEESSSIIFFPTCSSRLVNCYWISLKNIKNYKKNGKYSKIIFNNDYELDLDISYGSLENQILRSTLLESALRNRKK